MQKAVFTLIKVIILITINFLIPLLQIPGDGTVHALMWERCSFLIVASFFQQILTLSHGCLHQSRQMPGAANVTLV